MRRATIQTVKKMRDGGVNQRVCLEINCRCCVVCLWIVLDRGLGGAELGKPRRCGWCCGVIIPSARSPQVVSYPTCHVISGPKRAGTSTSVGTLCSFSIK